MPVSRTRTTAWSPTASTVSSMRPPSSEYLALLFSKFDTTWASRPGSPSTSTACSRKRNLQDVFPGFDQRTADLDGQRHHGLQVNRFHLEVDLAMAHARYVEQVVNQPGQLLDLTLDHPVTS